MVPSGSMGRYHELHKTKNGKLIIGCLKRSEWSVIRRLRSALRLDDQSSKLGVSDSYRKLTTPQRSTFETLSYGTMKEERFVIRVYAIIINDRNEVLLSDEYMVDTFMTKFPGGGMEFGEGPIDCLKREAIEELGQSIEIISHFYTTDFYQKALFIENTQLISIYYRAKFTEPIQFKISEIPFDFPSTINGSQSFRWRSIPDLSPEELTFPIDRVVAGLLKEKT